MGNLSPCLSLLERASRKANSAEEEFRKHPRTRIRDRELDANCDERTYCPPWNPRKPFLRSAAWKEQAIRDYLLGVEVGGEDRSCIRHVMHDIPRPWMHVGLSRWIRKD